MKIETRLSFENGIFQTTGSTQKGTKLEYSLLHTKPGISLRELQYSLTHSQLFLQTQPLESCSILRIPKEPENPLEIGESNIKLIIIRT